MAEQEPERKRGVRGVPARSRRQFTVETIKAMRPLAAADYVVWDAEVKRLALRVYPTGSKVYMVRLRAAGRQRWVRIGTHGDPWTPFTAREKALELLGVQAKGRDPAAERDLGKQTPTLAEFASRYITDHAQVHKKPRTVIEDHSLLGLREPKGKVATAVADGPQKKPRTILAALGSTRLDAISAAAVTRFHLSWKETPTRANRALALLSHMFTMAEKWGLREPGSNPCRHVDRFREAKRERFLSALELAQLGDALARVESRSQARRKKRKKQAPKSGQEPDKKASQPKKKPTVSPFALAALRLLVFTGARASEVLGLRWEAVDVSAGTARLADSKTGAKTLFLPAPATKLLLDLPRLKGNPYVIPGGREGQPLTLWGVEQAWQVVRAEAGLSDVRLHDLRHSFASAAAAGGQSLTVIGALLGHTQAQTTKRYAHLAADPLRAASDAVAGRIESALNAPVPKGKRAAKAAV